MGKSEKDEEKNSREALLLERKKITYNLVLLLAASFVVLIGVLTMAWFASNNKVDGTNMSVTVQAPDGVKISVGHLQAAPNNLYYAIEFDENEEIVEPIVGSDKDWFSEIDIGDYYLFGHLIPASSVSGEQIWYTSDAKGNGRKLKTTHVFYRADNMIGAKATAHAISYDNSNQREEWEYVPFVDWDETHDDGYYIDVPVWFFTDSDNAVNLTVRGYVTQNDGQTASDGNIDGSGYVEALYKATRVAILDDNYGAANTSEACGNIIPLLNGEAGNSILDSKNYTSTNTLFGVTSDGSTGWEYDTYAAYTQHHVNAQDELIYHSVVSLNRSTSPKKQIIRIWIDGDDRDCWNATAGQNWKINLVFSVTD